MGGNTFGGVSMGIAGKGFLPHRELTERIIGAFYEVYGELGHGFLESVYESALGISLTSAGIRIERQVPLKVHYRGIPVGLFRPDILVENLVVVELKAGRALEAAHEAQLLNCLKATQIEIGLLFNFGPKPQFKRMILNDQRSIRVRPCSSVAPVVAP
ncbi:MAG: GxxExxY protein [Gemmatimonadota bacterium]